MASPGRVIGGGKAFASPPSGRVGVWRAGLGRSLCSLLARSFVCECHTVSTVPRFQPRLVERSMRISSHCALLTWGVSGQAHHAAVPRTTSASVTHCEVLSLAPAAGASPAKRGEAQRSRERSDLDPPAAGYTVASERALARSWLPLRSLPRSFILTLRILLLRLDPKREPVFRHAALTAASPHIRSSLWGSDHNPSCSRASGSGWRDHPVKRRVSAREFIRGHRPPGSGEAVAFSFAGMGLSH